MEPPKKKPASSELGNATRTNSKPDMKPNGFSANNNKRKHSRARMR
jgi:hypothetical protein